MFNRKNKRAATAPTKTPAVPLNRKQTEEIFDNKKATINLSIHRNLEEIAKLKKPLPEMSKTLYGTEHYSTKKGYRGLLTFIVLLVVSALEIPLNATGLEMLGRPKDVTTLMALGLACALGLLAEGAGYSFKRASVRKSFWGFVGGIFCAGIALTIIYWLSQFRVAYFNRMKFRKEDIQLMGQVIFSIAVWFAGVVGVFFLTSGVKNLHAERVFKNKCKAIRILQKKNVELDKAKIALKNENATNLVAAEAYEKNVAFEKQRAENLQRELELARSKENEANLNKMSEEQRLRIGLQKNAFYSKYNELITIKDKVEKMVAGTEDKSELSVNEDYVTLVSSAETLVEQMRNLASIEIPGTDKDMAEANQIFENLKNLAA